jgi:hypothetical protein
MLVYKMAILGTFTATLLSCCCISTFTKPSASLGGITVQLVIQATCAATVFFFSRNLNNRFEGVRESL